MKNESPFLLGSTYSLGNCYMTPGIVDLVERFQFPARHFLELHQAGDPGVLDAEDVQANVDALKMVVEYFQLMRLSCNPMTV